ncbi:MAG: TIGR03643 family protein [Hyphomonadaceae bacterium]|nr:TIGR03643 family protein [Hyphomonadaceae bacterium]
MTDLTNAELSAVIEMAWDDDTSFDAIELQTGLLEKDVIAIMRREMKPSSFRMWRKRVTGRASKHRAKIQD